MNAKFAPLALLVVAWLFHPERACAAFKQWSGSSSGNWNTAGNWTNNAVPVNGDDLVFPANATRFTITNNLAGLKLRSIIFSGSNYVLRGNFVTLSNGITANQSTGLSGIELPVQLDAAQTFNTPSSAATLSVSGNVTNGGSLLTFTGNGSALVGGVLSGSGGLAKNGSGELFLGGSNTFAGVTTVNAGVVHAVNLAAFGSSTAGTTLNGGQIQLGGVTVANEPLTNNSTSSVLIGNVSSTGWGGIVHLAADLNLSVLPGGTLTLSGAISGTGNLTKTNTGTLRFTGGSANTHTGYTYLRQGRLELNKTAGVNAVPGQLLIGTQADAPGSAVVQLLAANQIANGAEVVIFNSGQLDLNNFAEGIGSLIGAGQVALGNAILTVGSNGSASDYGGVISGTGSVVKDGAGLITLSGTNTYNGSTTVSNGTLRINGSQTASAVILRGASRLEGNGAAGAVAAFGNGNVVSPGTSPGTLSTLNLTLSSTASLRVELNGLSPGTQYDRLNVTGAVTLNNAALDASLGFSSNPGDQFVIINNDGADAVIGTFNGLPEGSRLDIGGVPFTISYTAGTGNDVALTRIGTARTWDGGGANNFWTTAANWDAPAAAGDILIFPGGVSVDASSLSNTNDFPANTAFKEISITGTNYSLSGNRIVLTAGIIHSSSGTNTIHIPISLQANQAFSATTAAGHLITTANLDLSGFILTNAAVGLLSYSGVISGSGNIIKTGPGTLKLFGNSNNTYTGTTFVTRGTLALQKGPSPGNYHAVPGDLIIGDNVEQASNAVVKLEFNHQIADNANVVVNDSGLLDATGYFETIGSLAGSGFVAVGNANGLFFGGNNTSTAFTGLIQGGPLFKQGTGAFALTGNHAFSGLSITRGSVTLNGTNNGQVLVYTNTVFTALGTVGNINMEVFGQGGGLLQPGQSPGILNCGNLTLSSRATLEFELNGTTPGSGYDQLKVTGGITLSNASLNVVLGFTPVVGSSFTIIDNDGSDAVTNTFNGLPESSTFLVGSETFRISYIGGDGNDVVLTQITGSPAPPTLSIQTLPPDKVRLLWPTNQPGFNLQSHTNLATTNWVAATPPPTVLGMNNVVTNAITGSAKFYRLFKP